MFADLQYVQSLEKKIDELEYDKADFSNIYDLLLQECVSKDVMCSYLHSLSDLDAHTELQCLYLHKIKECECLAEKLNNQTETICKEVYNELLRSFAKLEQHSISLEIALQQCQEQMKNDTLKKLIEKMKGKSVDTKFDKPSIVRQPNALKIPKPSVLGKLTPFSDSLERNNFTKKKTTQTRASQLPLTSRNTNPRVSTSTGVTHKTSVSRPQLKSTQMKDKGMQNNSQVKFKKTEVEDHHRISSVSNKTKSVTACNDNLKSRTSNVNVVCVTCGKYVFNSNHDACVSKFINEIILERSFGSILGYWYLVQGNTPSRGFNTIEGHNHNLFVVGINLVMRNLSKKRSSIKTKTVPSSKGRLNLLHIDLCGPMWIERINGKKYILVIVHDYSRYTWTHYLRTKDETPEVLKDFLKMIQRNLQAQVITVRTDRVKVLSKTSDYDNFGHVPQLQMTFDHNSLSLVIQDHNNEPSSSKLVPNVSLPADKTGSSQQELDFLFSPLFEEYITTGNQSVSKSSSLIDNSNQQVTQPATPIQPTTEPTTPTTNVNAEENNIEFKQKFNPKMHKLTNMNFTTSLVHRTTEPKNIKDAIADSAWIEAIQDELHQFDKLQV
ncbi:retrovirus-related pol polyprotein from transposon TNT 1-94 [Tanacetum coccineum]